MSSRSPLLRSSLQWFVPRARTDLRLPAVEIVRLEQTREQLVTGLSRIMSVISLPLILCTRPQVVDIGATNLMAIYLLGTVALWLIALNRQWSHRARALTLVLVLYAFGVLELANFGYTEAAQSYLVLTALLTTLFVNTRAGIAALALSSSTLLGFGLLISLGIFSPLTAQMKLLSIETMATTWIVYTATVAVIQAGIMMLSQSLMHAWRDERQSSVALVQERALLEARVAGRTAEFATARDLAIAVSNQWLHQNQYLEALHHITIDLLNRRERNDLLRAIVEHATALLDAPDGQIMLVEHDALIVQAQTLNQRFQAGDRIRRGEVPLAWQAYDSQQPVVGDSSSSAIDQRRMADYGSLLAVAHFPIVVRDECLGILALGRTAPNRPFSPEQVQHGSMLARLVAVILDSVRQYELTKHEAHERQRALAALEATAADLRAQNAELDAFAHTVAHDIKNPLSSMMGYIQLLQLTQRELTPIQIDDELAKLLRVGSTIETIIDELLMLASMRSNESVTLLPLDMKQIVERLDERLGDLIGPSRAVISYPSEWPLAYGHESWVTEVWANYVSNAIKYGGSPPQVVLGADPPERGMIRFWVRDNGVGLSAEQQSRLFTAFTRLHIDQAPGNGLGLSIVQRIIEKLGGQVGIESTVGAGSTFFFTLPAVSSASEIQTRMPHVPAVPLPEIATAAETRTGRVLIAEDNAANQLIAMQMVRRLGYTADVVANGREALAACVAGSYAYILMDLQMPEMDGVSATKEIRALGGNIVQPWIIALSASALPSEYERLRAAGMNDFLGKPVTAHELREAFAYSTGPDSAASTYIGNDKV